MDLDFEFSQIKSNLNKILGILEVKHTDRELKMYDLADLERILHVSRRTIFKYKQQGKLECTQIGSKLWVSEKQLKAFLENNASK